MGRQIGVPGDLRAAVDAKHRSATEEEHLLSNVKDARGDAVRATDDEFFDLSFDDLERPTRHVVPHRGISTLGRTALVSRRVLGPTSTREPLPRWDGAEHFGYAGYPYYWRGTGVSDTGVRPARRTGRILARWTLETTTPPYCQRRGCKNAIGYVLPARQGDIGRVAHLVVDEQTWAALYLIAETTSCWGGYRIGEKAQMRQLRSTVSAPPACTDRADRLDLQVRTTPLS